MATKQDINATLARLAEAFPQTFVLEKHRPHRPLKVGIGIDLRTRCPELDPPALRKALGAYTKRVMYLEAMVAGAARIDLDGNPAGEVTAGEAEHAVAKLANIMTAREGRRATAMAAKRVERKAPPAPFPEPEPAATTSPAKVLPLKVKPVLRLPAFRTAAR
jgi:ProP effector